MASLRFGPAQVFLDGAPVGEAVSMSYSELRAGGWLVAPGGACPQCRTVSLNGEPIVCSHGVTLPGLPGGGAL